MLLRGRTLAIIILIGLAISIFKQWVLVVVGIIVLLWIIRLLADLYWWGKDNDKW